MGIDVYVFDFLLNFRGLDLGDALCLGRQGFHLAHNQGQREIAAGILAACDPEASIDNVGGNTGYSETFLKYLGCRTVRSLDFSPFEGAEIIYDLNKPVPAGLNRKFDLIFDGGTLEHIFNVPVAIASIRRMLRPGGLFLSVNAANNQLGHGLYQFSPELFWRAFGQENGYSIERLQLVPLSGYPAPIILSDPAGVRQELGPTSSATYIMVAARSPSVGSKDYVAVYQSDYAAAWSSRKQ